ncbi:MAG: hypothetical protein ACRCUJ_01360 [Phocaeicola sp.]
MKLTTQSHSSIRLLLEEALNNFTNGEGALAVTDIHLQPNSDTGELTLFDDDDAELARTIISEFVAYSQPDFYRSFEKIVRAELKSIKEAGLLDKVCIMKPYSFVLVDEEKESISELLIVDDEDTVLVDDELLKGLDEELNEFLKELLEK